MNLHHFVLFFPLLKVREWNTLPHTCQPLGVSCSAVFYVEFSCCTQALNIVTLHVWNSSQEQVFFTILPIPLCYGLGMVGNLLHNCPLLPTTNPPTPSREPWETESHHHGDVNTDPPHTGPLWLACVEVRGNKMSQQQVFLCFCFCLKSQWNCARMHVLSHSGGTTAQTVGVRETTWLEKWIVTWR